ncbi:MAG TPA: diguanylate cyclase [Candidatus Limnocylindria bacterium]|jgi:diguanylate cyclase (GGDEF)-like protein|nr:diguanylate cyclase [Candidatus Limnocylindria bacterium]
MPAPVRAATREWGKQVENLSERRAEDLLDSIFRVATELVRGERASLMLRNDATDDFVIAHALGLAEDVKREVRVRPGEGVAGHVLASKRSLLVRGGEAPVRVRGGQYRSDSFMSVPIVIDDHARGVLNVTDRFDGGSFEETDLATLEILAGHIGACLVQQEQGEALQRLAETDPLTWLFNRRHFDKRLEAETNRALRAEHLLALLMLDVDRLKLINDRFGHRAGDQVLKAVASAIKQAVRLYDVPTRYGGDEFAIILPEADTEVAARVARRVLEKAETIALPGELRDAGIPLSVSIGVATFPRPAGDANALVEAADSAMYRAKQAGGGIRVWEHAFADGPRGALRPTRAALPPAPYLSDPARLATRELQQLIPVALAEEFNIAVVGHEGQVITVAFPSPNPAAVDTISKATGFAVYPVFSNALDLEATRRRLAAA